VVAKRHNLMAEVGIGAWSIAKGLAVTFWNGVRRPRITENYPARPTRIFPRFRGRLMHLRDESGRLKCTACLACQKACPTLAIPHIRGDEKKGREKRAAEYVWEGSRCLFCNLCVEACPFGAIKLSQSYSTVGESRAELRMELERLLEPARPGGERPEGAGGGEG
jgi:NADH-quinone oxidoreductase subunit I